LIWFSLCLKGVAFGAALCLCCSLLCFASLLLALIVLLCFFTSLILKFAGRLLKRCSPCSSEVAPTTAELPRAISFAHEFSENLSNSFNLFNLFHPYNPWPKKIIQIPCPRCLCNETVNANSPHWSQRLYETKATELILYGRALGLSHAEAEDVLQETFVVLMQQEQCPAKLEHYCVRSFRNRALNYRRSLWRRVAREVESLRWFERATDESPAEREAMQCLAELPVEQREVIVLKIWQRRTFEEIGELLEVSPNTASGRYRYGLQKLKVRLEGEDYERQRDASTGNPIALLAATPAIPES
jgi:RNA polymerase sigma-70 factor (ECF subfamily)